MEWKLKILVSNLLNKQKNWATWGSIWEESEEKNIGKLHYSSESTINQEIMSITQRIAKNKKNNRVSQYYLRGINLFGKKI